MTENILTIEKLKAMEPNTVFASGFGLIVHPWFNDAKKISEGGSLEEDGRHTTVKWVAIRGGIHDWAIYHSLDANSEPADYLDGVHHLDASEESIARGGAKLRREEEIKKFVPCDEEAFKMYRY